MAAEGSAEFKQFLGSFCDKNGLELAYTDEEEETGFYCEVCCFHCSPLYGWL